MKTANRELVQPPPYRIWEPERRQFVFVDRLPSLVSLADRWTGLFDKQRRAVFERDIIQVYYNWKVGWINALVIQHPDSPEFVARATDLIGEVFFIGHYLFADSYLEGNLHQHPDLLRAPVLPASESEIEPWTLPLALPKRRVARWDWH